MQEEKGTLQNHSHQDSSHNEQSVLQLLETNPEEGKSLLVRERKAAIEKEEEALRERYLVPQEDLTALHERLEEPARQAMRADRLLGILMSEGSEFADVAEYAVEYRIKEYSGQTQDIMEFIEETCVTRLQGASDSPINLLGELCRDTIVAAAYEACPATSIKAVYECSDPPFPNFVRLRQMREAQVHHEEDELTNIRGEISSEKASHEGK